MTETPDLYGPEYFGHVPVTDHISNYSRVGGYQKEHAAAGLFADWFESLVARPARVLEIGCAQGHLVEELFTRGYDAYGIDYSDYILSIAVDSVKDRLRQGSMYTVSELDFVKSKMPFDAVVSKDVLEHVDPVAIKTVLKQLLAVAPVQVHVINTGQHEYQAWDGDRTHKIRRPITWWEKEFKKAGGVLSSIFLRET